MDRAKKAVVMATAAMVANSLAIQTAKAAESDIGAQPQGSSTEERKPKPTPKKPPAKKPLGKKVKATAA